MVAVEVGQEVFVVGIGNNARYDTPKYKGVVIKIGRKWFNIETVDARYVGERNRFSLEDGYCDGGGYSPEWQVYLTEQEYLEAVGRSPLIRELQTKLESLTYKQCKHIEQEIDLILLNGKNS